MGGRNTTSNSCRMPCIIHISFHISSLLWLHPAGRHGQGESLFLSSAWELNPDGVTFGKAIASGTFPLSGVAIRGGANTLLESGQKVVQGHTYAGSSSLAYLTAAQVLREVPAWLCNVKKLGELVIEILGPLEASHAHCCRSMCQGVGSWFWLVVCMLPSLLDNGTPDNMPRKQ